MYLEIKLKTEVASETEIDLNLPRTLLYKERYFNKLQTKVTTNLILL